MATKFKNLISSNGNDALARRANQFETQANIAQIALINSLKQRKSELELKLSDLTDLAPTSTTSLTPGRENWKANEWVNDIQITKMELYNLEIKLKLAEETMQEYFTEVNE